MKTAESIEAQEERKAARDSGDQPHSSREHHSSRELTQPVTQKSRRGDASRIAAWRWQPGKSANPGGVPKHDVAKEIAKAIFLNNPEMIYKAYSKMLRRGNAYAFQVLADRAFGKLKESIRHEVSPYRDLSDEQLHERIAQLKKELGWPASEPAVLPPADADSETKPN
jgi:hypothetical protein